MLVLGLPTAGGNLTTRRSIVVSGISMLAGAVMATAGYATADWNPAEVPPLILIGGAVITVAFIVAARGQPAAVSADP